MIGILLVSHEPLGTALLNCTRHIFGRLPVQLAALDVIPDEDPDAALGAARELLARINDGTGALVLTDVFGATPSRIAMQLADPGRVVVIAGVNLPLLIKALGHRRGPLGELVELLIESGQRAIQVVGAEGGESDDHSVSPDREGHAQR
jgi:PTS system mannose-specific IIA component